MTIPGLITNQESSRNLIIAGGGRLHSVISLLVYLDLCRAFDTGPMMSINGMSAFLIGNWG